MSYPFSSLPLIENVISDLLTRTPTMSSLSSAEININAVPGNSKGQALPLIRAVYFVIVTTLIVFGFVSSQRIDKPGYECGGTGLCVRHRSTGLFANWVGRQFTDLPSGEKILRLLARQARGNLDRV